MRNAVYCISAVLLFLCVGTSHADVITPRDSVRNHVNVRRTPDTSKPAIAILRKGQEMEYWATVPGWYKVKLQNGRPGYVAKSWTVRKPDARPVTGPAVPSSTERDVPEEPSDDAEVEARTEYGETFRTREMEVVLPPEWDDVVDAKFAGTYRRDVKTSFAIEGGELVPFETFDSVRKLIDNLLATSSDNNVKGIYKQDTGRSLGAKTNNEPRLPPEQRNVRLTTYIRAVKWIEHEDQDFHVMVCEGSTDNGQPCFTVEVSGLPRSGVREKDFRRARRELIAVMRDAVEDRDEDRQIKPTSMKNKWAFFDPGIFVEISGSLFLDAAHGPGIVGPRPSTRNNRNHTSETAWEIHPVYSVRLLDEE